MIVDKIKNEMIIQGLSQSEIIRYITEKGYKITPSQLSNFLKKRTSIHIELIDLIFEYMKIELVRIL